MGELLRAKRTHAATVAGGGESYLSVCDGIGAVGEAWSGLPWRPVMLSEIEAFPRAVLQRRHRASPVERRPERWDSVPLWGDFTAIRMRHFERFGIEVPSLLVGGTPCQAFSIAGLRKSLDDARGNLTFAFVRLANAIDHVRCARGAEPCVILWENVPGVLTVKDNAFGCFLAGLVGEDTALVAPRNRWPNAGLVVGPQRIAAWRTLDAQYFGLAQRRRRVFVVASAREGFDPSAVLFEPEGLRRDTPPRRVEAEDVASTVAGGARSRGGYSHDDTPLVAGTLTARLARSRGLGTPPELLAFGGNNTQGPIEITPALLAQPGSGWKGDFDSETFLVERPAYTLAVGGAASAEVSQALTATGEAEQTSNGTRVLEPVCFSSKDWGHDAAVGISPTLRAAGHNESHANAGAPPAIAFALRGREEGALPEVHGDGSTAGTLRAAEGGSSRDYVAAEVKGFTVSVAANAYAWERDVHGTINCTPAQSSNLQYGVRIGYVVRRLMPVECERLQGYPDNYTLIPWRGGWSADGPRYKALGNSMAVPVMRWLGERIEAEAARARFLAMGLAA